MAQNGFGPSAVGPMAGSSFNLPTVATTLDRAREAAGASGRTGSSDDRYRTSMSRQVRSNPAAEKLCRKATNSRYVIELEHLATGSVPATRVVHFPGHPLRRDLPLSYFVATERHVELYHADHTRVDDGGQRGGRKSGARRLLPESSHRSDCWGDGKYDRSYSFGWCGRGRTARRAGRARARRRRCVDRTAKYTRYLLSHTYRASRFFCVSGWSTMIRPSL